MSHLPGASSRCACAAPVTFREALECASQGHRFGRGTVNHRADVASIESCGSSRFHALPKRWLCHAQSKVLRTKPIAGVCLDVQGCLPPTGTATYGTFASRIILLSVSRSVFVIVCASAVASLSKPCRTLIWSSCHAVGAAA